MRCCLAACSNEAVLIRTNGVAPVCRLHAIGGYYSQRLVPITSKAGRKAVALRTARAMGVLSDAQ